MQTKRYVTHRALPQTGRFAFARAAYCAGTMHQRHFLGKRPVASLRFEDDMLPGKGSA